MRPSCYLNTVEIGDGDSLLYNGFSMCMDVVPSEIAQRLISSEVGGDFSFLTPAETEYLVKRGHLTGLTVQDEQDEMAQLVRAIAERDIELNEQPFGGRLLTFILTYKCNLSCAYCFQNDIRETSRLPSMSEAFADDFLRNCLGKLFPDTPKDKLRFILFGGEPLLPGNRGAIERILHFANEHGIIATVATNSVTLPQMLDLIGPQKGRINNVQVTLDGDQVFHDERRVFPSGAPTFERTIRALRDLIKAEAKAIVRIHLHPGRLESARMLVDYLDKEKILGHDNVEIYFAPVHSFHARGISPRDFDIFSNLFQYVALKQKTPPIQNFGFLEQIMDVKTTKSWSQPRYCAVSSGMHYAVDPLGDIYECLEEAGHKERRIGTISGGEVNYFRLRNVYRERYLASMPECLKCSIALFCGGGCISKTRIQGGSSFRQFCVQNKVFAAQTLRACFLLKQAGKAAQELRPFIGAEKKG